MANGKCVDGMKHGDCDETKPKEENGKITLKVEESILTVQLNQLRSKPETMLAKMFTSGMAKANERGEYEIHNVKPKILKGILDYYRKGLITIPENVCYEEMKEACDYLLIPFSLKTVQNIKSFLSIQTDFSQRELYHNLFEEEIFPHLNEVSENGKNYCDVYLVQIQKPGNNMGYPAVNGVHNLGSSKSAVVFYVETKLLDLFTHFNDLDAGGIKSFLYSKGFNVTFKEENDPYYGKPRKLIATFKW